MTSYHFQCCCFRKLIWSLPTQLESPWLLRGHRAGQISAVSGGCSPSGVWSYTGITSRAAASTIGKKLLCFPQVETKEPLQPQVISSAFDEAVVVVKERAGMQCCTGNNSVKLFSCAAEHVYKALSPAETGKAAFRQHQWGCLVKELWRYKATDSCSTL